MKKTLLAAALTAAFSFPVSAAKDDTTILVFGDSLSSPHNSWAEMIDDWGYAHVQNFAIGGTRLIDIELPSHMVCQWQGKTTKVVLWAGTNDYFRGVPVDEITDSLRDKLDRLLSEGCEPWVFLPPYIGNDAISNQKLIDAFVVTLEDYPTVNVLDVLYDQNHTIDGVHQTEFLHWVEAVQVIQAMGLEQ